MSYEVIQVGQLIVAEAALLGSAERQQSAVAKPPSIGCKLTPNANPQQRVKGGQAESRWEFEISFEHGFLVGREDLSSTSLSVWSRSVLR